MTAENVKKNLLRVKEKIAHCTPNIVAVTKYYGREAIIDGYNAGLRDFGEARINDAIEKLDSLPPEIKENSSFHYIGHVQSRQAEKVVKYFDCIQSVDSLKLARIISTFAEKYNKEQNILIQVNISQEEQKFGFDRDTLYDDFEEIIKLSNLNIKGLMCMAPFGASDEVLDMVFKKAVEIKDDLNKRYHSNLQELSMGMSNDYERAVANGATIIRLGRILFE